MAKVSSDPIDLIARLKAIGPATPAVKQKVFRWDSNPLLKKALEAKLFEDTKDHIKLSAFSSGATTVDPDVQKKIDAVKQRLVEKYGYNEQSATDVLDYVSSIFARGDLAEDLF